MLSPRSRRFPLLALGLVVLLVVPAVAVSSVSDSKAGPQVLRVGTSYYISSLNPFVGIETNDSLAYSMVYPQLVQYVPGPRIGSDWASSWKSSNGGRTWTFRLKKGKWSDGTPLTAADAVWTINTVLQYKNGPTSYVASSYDGIKGASAPDPQTLVISYSRPIAPALSNLSQTYILPKHVWSTKVGKNGKGLKEFKPQESLPNVSGGPYIVTQYQQKGTTAFKPNPNFYGPKSKSAGVAFTYYTNATSMVVDMGRGKLEYIDSLPYGAADAANGKPGIKVNFGAGSQVTNLGFNSNPRKSRNRELLDPRLKEAFEYAIPRRQIVDVIFSGHAKPWATSARPPPKAEGWLNPAVKPLPYNVAKVNAILDKLGYERGADGLRVAPATSGKLAQPAHPMSYSVIVPKDLDFNGDRKFDILATAFRRSRQAQPDPGGDGAQAFELIHGAGREVSQGRHVHVVLASVHRPVVNLSVVTKAEWYNKSDTGFDDPLYDGWWKKQARS